MNKATLSAPAATRCARRSVIAGPAAAGYRHRYLGSRDGAVPVACGAKGNARRLRAVLPNPSFEARPNGKPPGPGRWYAVHFHRPGPGVLPLVPPQLER